MNKGQTADTDILPARKLRTREWPYEELTPCCESSMLTSSFSSGSQGPHICNAHTRVCLSFISRAASQPSYRYSERASTAPGAADGPAFSHLQIPSHLNARVQCRVM